VQTCALPISGPAARHLAARAGLRRDHHAGAGRDQGGHAAARRAAGHCSRRLVSPRRDPAVRGGPGGARGVGDKSRAGSRGSRGYGSLCRFFPGLPGCGAQAARGRGGTGEPMGHWRAGARPDRAARHAARARPGPPGPVRGPAGGRAAGLPRAGPVRLPRPGPRGTPALPGARRVPASGRAEQGDPGADPGHAARSGAADGRGEHRQLPGHRRLTVMAAPVFDDLVGQEPVVAQLEQAAAAAAGLLRGEPSLGMTHAWLFTGPPGSGRSVAARAFAAALLCPDQGCGHCPSCHQVRAGTHPDLMLVRPDGLSYGVKQTRDLVLRAAGAPSGGRWQVVLFEDADRATEQAANALLKAIEEPSPRTVWLLCAPSAEELVTTIRSRCRLVTLRTPAAAAVAGVLSRRDGVEPAAALAAARAAQGHIGRARRLATDPEAAQRRDEVLRVPARITSLGSALSAAAGLVKGAEQEAAAVTEELNVPEREA